MSIGTEPSRIGFVSPLSYDDIAVTSDGATASRTLGAYTSDMPSVFNWGLDTASTDEERHTAIQAAVTHCYNSGQNLYWPGNATYVVDDTIDNFHDVQHHGNAKIQRGTDIWHITPRDSQRNSLHVSASGTIANDGLSSDFPCSIASAWLRVKSLGKKALQGVWRINLATGSYTDTGLVISDFPYFKTPLEIYGTSTNLASVPTTVWNGAGNSAYAAIRGGLTDSENGFLNVDFRNIKLEGFSQNGIIYWYNGRVQMKNVHSDGIPYPFDYRGIRLDATGGKVENYTMGYRSYYGCNSNIGGLGTDEDITFVGNNTESTGVSVSRGGIAYIEGCNFSGDTAFNIAVSKQARIRTQGNTYGGFNDGAVLVEDGRWDTPKESENADTYPALSESAPAYRARGNASIQYISTLANGKHHRSGDNGLLNVCQVSGTTAQTLLHDASVGSTGFVPFRLPKHFLFSPTFKLIVEMELALAADHGGGELALHLGGTGNASKLATIDISAVSSFSRGKVVIELINDVGASTASYNCSYAVGGDYSNGSSGSLNSSLIRDNTADIQLYRLYWTPNDAGSEIATFSNLITYVEL